MTPEQQAIEDECKHLDPIRTPHVPGVTIQTTWRHAPPHPEYGVIRTDTTPDPLDPAKD